MICWLLGHQWRYRTMAWQWLKAFPTQAGVWRRCACCDRCESLAEDGLTWHERDRGGVLRSVRGVP